jgi:DNA processing protein
MTTAALGEAAYVTALAALPDVGPARLRALLADRPADAVFADLAAGALRADARLAAATGRSDPTPLLRAWSAAAAALDVGELWSRHVAAGIEVLTPADARWPVALRDDPDPPAILFARGRLEELAGHGPRVAVVGTRRCTRYGWDVAHHLGTALAGEGVAVVSGLAAGIDGAAHRGALDAAARQPAAAPIGVVGTGLDVAYPRSNRGLWDEVSAAGVLVGEAPLGTRPARWRFPARNRIIAALAEAVVVVESAAHGGALHTVDEAEQRGRTVLAVPGPITSPASVGTNLLLRDAALPVCDVDDVLCAIGRAPSRPHGDPRGSTAGPEGDPDANAVLDALGWTPATLDAVVAASGLPLGRAAAAVARLERAGFVVAEAGGGRWERAQRGAEVTG